MPSTCALLSPRGSRSPAPRQQSHRQTSRLACRKPRIFVERSSPARYLSPTPVLENRDPPAPRTSAIRPGKCVHMRSSRGRVSPRLPNAAPAFLSVLLLRARSRGARAQPRFGANAMATSCRAPPVHLSGVPGMIGVSARPRRVGRTPVSGWSPILSPRSCGNLG